MIAVGEVPIAVLALDHEATVVEANDRAASLLGHRSPVGCQLHDLLADVDPRAVGVQRTIVVGTSREIRAEAAPRPDGGSVLVLTEPTVDPTAAQTIATVSHELRSPLTSLRGFVGLLRSRWDRLDDDQRLEILEQVDHDAGRVGRLLTELLDISRLDAGRLVVRPERFALRPLVEGIVERLALGVAELGCVVSFGDDLEVFADRGKVEQILVNLLENAAKYGSPDRIEVTAAVVADAVVVSVADAGPGVDPADHERVFDRFFRHDDGRPDGLGLGLFISRALAEAHGGSLTLDAKDRPGARFCLTLPLTPPAISPS